MNALRTFFTFVFSNIYAATFICIILWVGAPYMSDAGRQMVSFAVVNILLANSINILTGMVGQISLGQAAFMGIAAYTSVILVKSAMWPLWLSIPCATVFASAAGYLLSFPAGRVKEFYLAMMTLAFSMIFVEIVREWSSLTGGVMGITGTPSPQLGNLTVFGTAISTTDYVRILIVIAGGVVFALAQFSQSRFGRAFFAVHESESAAESIGINSTGVKRLAYTISAGLAGLGGALYGHLVSYIGPEAFELHRSIEILVMSVIGGLGSLVGQILGAVTLTWLPLQLEAFADFKFIIYGVVLVAIFVVMPRGIAGILFLPPRFLARRFLKAQSSASAGSVAERQLPGGNVVLSWRDLRRDFAGLVAVTDFSFELKSGEVVALVGPNGSGKSTTINVLTGIYAPTAGQVILKGEDVSGLPSHAIAKKGLVRTFQDPRLVGRFTVLENVLLGAHLHFKYGLAEAASGLGRTSADEREAVSRADAVIELMGLTDKRDRIVETLPYGYRRLVEVARAMMVEPEVVLLDEPAAGLSEGEIQRLEQVIRNLSAQGVAVLIVDHHMDFLAGLVDSVVVLDGGIEIFRGDMDSMRRDETVTECYLGKFEKPDA